ncbi:MAG: restriction endonuclease subunit S [Xanthomonadaceae bacterium]|nr:restriction endonuclease subunit S [Xanthomonadaceae bacterium]
MSELPQKWVGLEFGTLNSFASRNINPAEHPDEIFELYSVPVFPTGKPEITKGKGIGSAKQMVQPGDVLVCKINPRINRVWIVGAANGLRQIASSEWIVMRALGSDARYLRHYFASNDFRELLCTDLTGVGGSLTRAQPKRVAAYEVPLAPLNEQTRIADKLDALLARVDAARERLDRIPHILKRFRQSVLAAATSGDLTEDWREGTSAEWKELVFDEACEEITVGYVGKMADAYRSDGVPFLRSLNVRPFKFNPADMRFVSAEFHQTIIKSKLQPGDVVVVRSGAPGQCCVIPDELPEANCSDLVIVRPKKTLLPKFACIFVNAEKSQTHIRSQQVGVAQQHFNVKSMKETPLLLPSTAEQSEIIRRVESLFAFADAVQAQYTAARARVDKLTPALLAKAFRGELVPQDPNDEPAEKLLARLREANQGAARPVKRGRKPTTA